MWEKEADYRSKIGKTGDIKYFWANDNKLTKLKINNNVIIS